MKRLTYYIVRPSDSLSRHLDYQRYPELNLCHPTEKEARACAELVLARVYAAFEKRVQVVNERAEPDAAKRQLKNEPTRHACISETRIVHYQRDWGDQHAGSRPAHWPEDPQCTLRIATEARHRFREIIGKTTVLPDGTVETSQSLGEPGPWTEWGPLWPGEGGIHFDPVTVELRLVHLDFNDHADLSTWAASASEKDQ